MKIQSVGRYLFPAAVLGAAVYCLSGGDCRIQTPDQKGFRMYLKGEYNLAASEFGSGMWKGVALFKAGEFKSAAGVFAGYDTPAAAYNQGNSLLMLGQYEAAIGRYDRALELDEGFADAVTNREIARARMLALQTEGGDMTGGMLPPDEIVFNEGKSSPDAGEENTDGGKPLSDSEIQAMWLRQVQTKPSDFLKSKFAYQYAIEDKGKDAP